MIDINVIVGENVVFFHPELSNVYGCTIGDDVEIGPFVEIQKGAIIYNNVKICSHSFICEDAIIRQHTFIGHGVMFCNVRYPLKGWPILSEPPIIGAFASIGTGAVILPGVNVGHGAIIGAGAVVARDVPALAIAAGNPARVIRQFANMGERDAHVS